MAEKVSLENVVAAGDQPKTTTEPQAYVPQRSYAFFIGSKDGSHRFKFLTRAGDPKFKRFEGDVKDGYQRDIFVETDGVWREDPALRTLPYFDEIVQRHNTGNGRMVEWNPDEYVVYAGAMRVEAAALARKAEEDAQPRDPNEDTDEIKITRD